VYAPAHQRSIKVLRSTIQMGFERGSMPRMAPPGRKLRRERALHRRRLCNPEPELIELEIRQLL
jgi:hypothetical protein